MLIEFSVENHRAFREKQTFSMVASAAMERAGSRHVAHTGFSAVPYVLREACLFGANGSGKSSLIDAMAFMSRFVRTSFRNEPGAGIKVEPFLFHSEWRCKPSEFEVIFIHGENQYQYGFSVTRERVVEEWLFSRHRSTGRQRHLFTRSFDKKKGSYHWDISPVHLKGERDSWRSQTRDDALFLSTAVQLKAEALKEPYEWLKNQWKILGTPNPVMPDQYTSSRFGENGWSERVINFLRQADIAIADIDIDESAFFETQEFLSMPTALQGVVRESVPEDAKHRTVYTIRKDEKGDRITLKLDEESSGTISLFKLAGPIIDVLDNGYMLVVDELNSGLHPLAFQHLISMFCDQNINKKNAQLIFTTHDTSVTERNCIGRDQIWLLEKGDNLAARLVPYSDFKTRNARSFQKGYLQGRFGAVPRIAG